MSLPKYVEYVLHLGLKTNKGVCIDQGTVECWLIRQLGQHDIDGFTISGQEGYWKGISEHSIRVSCLSERDLSSIFRLISTIYCHDFQQDAVLFTQQYLCADFVS